MSLPEVLLWQRLRGCPDGISFRRQHPMGAYVLDFYCPAAKLAIEVDGIAHDMGDRPEQDAARDVWLADQDVSTVRIRAVDVLKSPSAVAERIVCLCRDRS